MCPGPQRYTQLQHDTVNAPNQDLMSPSQASTTYHCGAGKTPTGWTTQAKKQTEQAREKETQQNQGEYKPFWPKSPLDMT